VDTLDLKFSEPEPKPRTRRRAFATGALFGFLVPVFVLMFLPTSFGNGVDARRSQGQQLAGSLQTFIRVEYAKRGYLPRDFPIPTETFSAEYYQPAKVVGRPTPSSAEVFMIPKDDYHPTIRLTFEWAGQGEFEELGATWGP
jgi:hypothetical protein